MDSIAATRQAHEEKTERLRARLGRAARLLLVAMLAALALRGFFFEPYRLPSQSIQPGLQPGDTIFVAKWPYGLSRHNLPLSPTLLAGRLAPKMPERGDVIVFKTPRDGQTDLVKRVIARGGDQIAMRGGRPILNGQPLPRTVTDTTDNHLVLRETLPSGRSFPIQTAKADQKPVPTRADFGPLTVPPGHVFLLGDNRDASTDSRYSIAEGGIGFVPLDLVVGRVDHILYGRTSPRAGTHP